MKKLLEVYTLANPDGRRECLLRQDLTGAGEVELSQALQSARDRFGMESGYFWHDCGHDEGATCTILPA